MMVTGINSIVMLVDDRELDIIQTALISERKTRLNEFRELVQRHGEKFIPTVAAYEKIRELDRVIEGLFSYGIDLEPIGYFLTETEDGREVVRDDSFSNLKGIWNEYEV